MAELNVFKTVTKTIDTSNQTIYTAPSSYTGIVLSTQIANASDSDATLTFTYQDSASASAVELLYQFDIPANDAANGTMGKLVVSSNGILKMVSNKDNKLKLVMGILESLNG
jgi:hypothetical protein